MKIVPLPRDGAAYHCTFTSSERCDTVTTVGLDQGSYDAALAAKPKGVSLMRALCPKHLALVARWFEDSSVGDA